VRIAWIQVVVAFLLGSFFGPMVMGMFTGKNKAANSGGY
jgi:hypothetical protein